MPASSAISVNELTSALARFLPRSDAFPDLLHRAMHYAVFSGGKLGRPRLLLAVYAACGVSNDTLPLALRAACAVEYVHAGSLVHDDLPCFDGANERRGKPSTHAQFGEAMAVLVGDALLSRAFEIVAEVPASLGPRALRVIQLLGTATSSQSGIIGGQSIEQQGMLPVDTLDRYHSMKTAALFRLAAEAGAITAGATNSDGWGKLGHYLGLAYQLADDIRDYRAAAALTPNAVKMHGEQQAAQRMERLLKEVRDRGAALTTEKDSIQAMIAEVEQWAVTIAAE